MTATWDEQRADPVCPDEMVPAPGYTPATLELWRRYWSQRDTTSRNALLLAYDPLVRKAVRRLPAAIRAGGDHEDLYSFGLFGLIDAIEKCEEGAAPQRFPAYASYRIRGAIIDELRRLDWVPRATRRRIIAYRTAADELSGRLGRTPHHEEVCASLSLDDDAGRGVLRAVADARIVSLAVGSGDETGAGRTDERPVQDDGEGPEECLLHAERRAELAAAISQLSERQRQVIAYRFVSGLTQYQIASMLGITAARVCQLEAAALKALRKSLGAEPLFDELWRSKSAS